MIKMKMLAWVVWIGLPLFLMVFFASLLTTNPYMKLSYGWYESHDLIEGRYDHGFVSRKLIDYLNYRHDDLTFGAFPGATEPVLLPIEIRHMEDVKDVYTLLRIIAGISLVLCGAITFYLWRYRKKWFLYTYRNVHWVTLGFSIFVLTWFLIAFDQIFTWFHLLLFDNDDWILPSDSTLIILLPEMFWMVSGLLIIIGMGVTMAIMVLFARRASKAQGLIL